MFNLKSILIISLGRLIAYIYLIVNIYFNVCNHFMAILTVYLCKPNGPNIANLYENYVYFLNIFVISNYIV